MMGCFVNRALSIASSSEDISNIGRSLKLMLQLCIQDDCNMIAGNVFRLSPRALKRTVLLTVLYRWLKPTEFWCWLSRDNYRGFLIAPMMLF